MNYEEKYKEALAKARQLCEYPVTRPFISELQDLFPELAESEERRIMKAIKHQIEKLDEEGWSGIDGVEYSEMLAWLEKQGDKKQEIKLIFPKFRVGDRIFKTHNSDINKCGIFTITKITEQGYWHNEGVICAINEEDEWELQPPAEWSKEDEKRIENILSVLNAQRCWNGATGKKEQPYQKEIDWIKSLRPHYKRGLPYIQEYFPV